MPAALDLLRIGAGQSARVTALLARAFQDDPMMVFAFPNARRRARSLPRLIGLNVRYAVRYGEVYATPGVEGAAVWLPPGRRQISIGGMLRVGALLAPLTVSWVALRRMSAVGAREARLYQRYAPMPCWYLSQIGVEPALQGRGFGGRLLVPLLARMDARGLPVYLETTTASNVALYQRYGFEVVAEIALNRGPRAWAMLRLPLAPRGGT